MENLQTEQSISNSGHAPLTLGLWLSWQELKGRRTVLAINVILVALLVAHPVSFDFIGKAASGLADDPVTLLLAATTAPVLLAPAMHDTMWAHPILKRNLETLKDVGYQIIPPEAGLQATGDRGEGRMASIGSILKALRETATSIPKTTKE